MTQALVLAGSVAAVAGLATVALVRLRMASVAEAVARACHELRGPLAAARLGLELSSRGGSTADPRLRAIELELARATLALEDLDRLWDGSRSCRGEAQQREPVDVARLLADSVEAWQGQASVRGVGLQLLDSGVRPIVRGDRLRLAQATGNLIANAIEHGGGVVEVSWHVDAGVVRIEVRDHGSGLPAPVAELAVRRSRRWGIVGAPGSRRTRRRPGSRRGHGLAIANAIAASHRGRLASAPSEHGARLVLELRHAEQTSVGPSRDPAGPSHPRIAG